MIYPRENTYIIVDNPVLKLHPQAYQLALNWVDHMIYRHQLAFGKNGVPGPYKYIDAGPHQIRKLTVDDITSCETEFAFIIKIGSRHDPKVFRFNAYPEFSLTGHILDRHERYYEVHQQSFLVRCQDLVGCDFYEDSSYRSVERATENFHDDYTPTWVKDGGDELCINKVDGTYGQKTDFPLFGAGMISHLLRTGKKISTYDPKIRATSAYLYENQIYKKVQKFNNSSDLGQIFPVGTESVVSVDTSGYDTFIGPANGLQALAYMNPNLKSITLLDISQKALAFTSDFIYNWKIGQSYESFLQERGVWYEQEQYEWSVTPDDFFMNILETNPNLLEVIKKIRSNEIKLEMHNADLTDVDTVKQYFNNKTLLYYSNVLSYSPTIHNMPLIDGDLIWQALLSMLPDDSLFIGEVPYRDYSQYHRKLNNTVYDINDKEVMLERLPTLRTEWRTKLYDTYYDIGIHRIRKDMRK